MKPSIYETPGRVKPKNDGVIDKWVYGTKVCRCCQARLELKSFSADNTKKDGLRNVCKSCEKKRSKSYRKNQPTAKTQLSDPETKQKTLDFIFGKSEENPIKRS